MQVGLGCVSLGTVSGGRSWRADVQLVEQAVDRGIGIIDTADAYASGGSERIVGRALHERRDRVELATKGGFVFRDRSPAEQLARRWVKALRDRVRPASAHDSTAEGGGGNYTAHDFSPPAMRRALEASLRRLGTDHIDVYQLHGPSHVMPEAIQDLKTFVTEGKVRRVGVGCETIASAAAWSKVGGIDVLQMPVGILDPDAVDVARAAGRRGVEVWARGVFAGGVLAAADRDATLVDRDPKGPLITDLRRLAASTGTDVYELALGFVRSVPEITTVLLGMSSTDHLQRNLELAAAPPLSPDVLDELRMILDAWESRRYDG